jgi:Beta-lactamase enzyme family
VRADPAPKRHPDRAPAIPGARQLADARGFAADRLGSVSFAVVDSRRRPRDMEGDRRFVTASVVKAMLLAAELDRLEAAGAPLDATTTGLLESMITFSDNAAADAVYARVGDAGLEDVARRAGLERFSVAGHWANAQLTADDMARLMSRIDELLEGPHARFGSSVLERIVPEQRWGIPAAVSGQGWSVRFKGGWRRTEAGQLVHQIAHLRRGESEVSLAVLTDGGPTMEYGIETIQGIAARLLGTGSDAAQRDQSERSSERRSIGIETVSWPGPFPRPSASYAP